VVRPGGRRGRRHREKTSGRRAGSRPLLVEIGGFGRFRASNLREGGERLRRMDEATLAETGGEELEGMRTIRLRIPARAEYVALARLALSGLADIAALPEEQLADLKLALTEAVSNSVRHASAGTRSRSRSSTTARGSIRRGRRCSRARSSPREVSASRSSARSPTTSSCSPGRASAAHGFALRSGCSDPPDRCQARQRHGVSFSSSSTAHRFRTRAPRTGGARRGEAAAVWSPLSAGYSRTTT